MPRQQDFVDEYIKERAKKDPGLPGLVEAALEQRKLLRALAAARESAGVSQTVVASRMGTSQSAVARIETGEADVRLSTLSRYAAALGKRVSWSVHEGAARAPSRVNRSR